MICLGCVEKQVHTLLNEQITMQDRPVGSKFQLVRRGSRVSNKACEARLLGGSGGMPPQENFAF